MSIANAFSAASSGLSASSRMAEVIASNVSNALSEDYARRSVTLTSQQIGNTGVGVRVSGIEREVNSALLQGLRAGVSSEGYHKSLAEFHTTLEKAIGNATDGDSLTSRITALEGSVISAAAQPSSEARLTGVLNAARHLTGTLQKVSKTIQDERQSAEDKIATHVAQINESLTRVAQLNVQISKVSATGGDIAALEDSRQKTINNISEIIPIKEQPGSLPNQVSLRTAHGIVLLDGTRPFSLQFTRTAHVTPTMRAGAGGLSGLSINGHPLSTEPNGGSVGQGALTALFEIRDGASVQAQTKIDALARNLVERFSSPTLDPSLAGGTTPGLFTDNSAVFVAANEAGLASRISVSSSVDPDATGGALWRLREGIGRTTATAPSDSKLLTAMAGALSSLRTASSGGFSGAGSVSDFASEFLSGVSVNRLEQDNHISFVSAQTQALRTEFLNGGVNTDSEMQDLLNVEQAYAANAKVIQALDQMLQSILEI